DLWDVDIRRMQPHQNDKTYLRTRTAEALGLTYAMHWPFRQFTTARGIRKTPLHGQLAEAGAVFGEVAGWERANWFANLGQEREYRYSFGRQNWFDNAAAEVRAVREAVGLIDLSTLAKYRVEGADALACLQHISAAEMNVEVGRSVYTQWLNARAGIEADLTVIREAADRFLVLTGAAASRRDLAWLRGNLLPGAQVTITDATTETAVLGVMGPKARDLLQTLTSDDISHEGFPFAACRPLTIAGIQTRATRISYVGELGWEVHVAWADAPRLFDAIRVAGGPFGLRLIGMHAVDSLRIEKGYRHWGHDLTEEDSPIEAGLAFAVAFDKPGGFLGREALLAERAKGTPGKRLVQFILQDPEPILYHNEPIYRDGKLLGLTSSAAYGHHLGGAVALGYVRWDEGVSAEFVASGTWEIEIGLERFAATASLRPLHDPTNARMRC
ncbi:MAG: FAD-dependent oxidoreductase, partial [Tabrizicola sp.]|nr:FAD-dependent oxidoreductase [Tabrizicola sp.]